MLRDVKLLDDDRDADCQRRINGVMSGIKFISQFSEGEIIDHFDALEVARDRLSEILDKAQGK